MRLSKSAYEPFPIRILQLAGALDDLAEMFIKRMLAIHQKGKEALERYRADHQARTDALALTLRDLWPFYKNHRAQLFRLLSVMELRSSSQESSMQEAMRFLKQHEHSKGDWLVTSTIQQEGSPQEQRLSLVDLSWASDTWWKFMTGYSKRA